MSPSLAPAIPDATYVELKLARECDADGLTALDVSPSPGSAARG